MNLGNFTSSFFVNQSNCISNRIKDMNNLSIAVVCASNQNRSMAAHKALKDAEFNVSSYGTGSQVKLPGPTAYRPNVYNFGTPYEEIIQDLLKKDERLYNY